MRKNQKKQILELINTIQEVHNEIGKLLEKKCYDEARDLLAQCQEAAIEIGNSIEEWEGKQAGVVSDIVIYCETLFKIYESISSEISGEKTYKTLRDIMSHIQKRVHEEIAIKLQVVFLPYKASMWDSLESVWLAAQENPNCECYVIPIPYFDRNKEGTLGEMYYEGNEFPDYVPITDWQTFNMEKECPDIIYFQNPYDQHNYVTSVHPTFYTKKLKEYTDMLVYIPYFVSTYNVPSHFCVLNGIIYADKVVLQSEIVRQTYINVFLDTVGKGQQEREKNENLRNEAYWHYLNSKVEKKFVALGSPKIDMVQCYQKNPPEMPTEWVKFINHKIGSDSEISNPRIILYNTHLQNLISKPDKVIKKLKDVFSYFKNQKDVILLWRPHPLSEATVNGMREEYLELYKSIVNEYKEERIGIYDDSPDVHRAIAVSDVYYGDMSSLVSMYGITGKPIILQGLHVSKDSRRIPLRINKFFDDGDYKWFTSLDYNGVYRIKNGKKEVEFIGYFEKEPLSKSNLYIDIVAYKNKLVFVPGTADVISVYEKDTMKWITIHFELDESKKKKYKSNKFGLGIRYKNFIFMFGSSYPVILKLNMETYEINYFYDWSEEIYVNDSNECYFNMAKIIQNNIAFVPMINTNAILELDMESCNIKLHRIKVEAEGFAGITYDGSNYWILPRKNGNVFKWNKEDGNATEYRNLPQEFTAGSYKFQNIVYSNNKILLFSYTANMNISIDIMTGEMKEEEKFDSISKEDEIMLPMGCRYPFAYNDGENIIVLSACNNKIITYNTNSEQVMDSIFVNMPEKLRDDIINEINSNMLEYKSKDYYIYREDEIMNIKNFGEFNIYDNKERMEKQREIFMKLFSNSDGSAGQKILNNILKEMID